MVQKRMERAVMDQEPTEQEPVRRADARDLGRCQAVRSLSSPPTSPLRGLTWPLPPR